MTFTSPSRCSLPTAVRVAVAAVAAVAALSTVAAPADAAVTRIDVSGFGTHVIDADGAAVVSAPVTGRPFGGDGRARVAALDGSLPEPGMCEPATARLRVSAGRKHVVLAARGDVCGQYVQPPFIATQAFTGRYRVVRSSRPSLLGTDGFLEVRLGDDGSGSVLAIDT